MKRLGFFILLVALASLSVSLAGCGSVGVEVWERDVLAKSEMQLDSEMVDRALDDHIYFSKEASSGGRGFGGGGCGCN
jgi:predicted small lipoprotein YifL